MQTGNQNFTTSILVEQSPETVFKAINDPRAWWSAGIEGTTDEINAIWNYHFGDSHRCKIKVAELIPGEKVVWLIEENYFKNAKDQSEWVGNKIVFDISTEGDKTKLAFTQVGLVPSN